MPKKIKGIFYLCSSNTPKGQIWKIENVFCWDRNEIVKPILVEYSNLAQKEYKTITSTTTKYNPIIENAIKN